MNVEDLRAYILSKPQTNEDLKWGENLCFMVCGKIFFVLGVNEFPVTAAFKIKEENFDTLTESDNIRQAPYFAKRQWVKVHDLTFFNEKEWKLHIDNAYKLIAAKLTKKLQKELGLI